MSHRPICVKCLRELRPHKNGVNVLDMAEFGPYKLWEADLWKCPQCGTEIVTGFGEHAYMHHCEPAFPGYLESLRRAGEVYEVKP